MGEGSGMGGVGANNLAKGGGAYAKTNDEANRDKTATTSHMTERVDIGSSTTLSGGTDVIERNASSTLIEEKKQPAKTLPEVAGGNEVMGEGTSMGGAGAKTLAKGAGAYAKTNYEANREKTETPSPMVEGVAIGNSTTLSGGTKVIECNASGKIIE